MKIKKRKSLLCVCVDVFKGVYDILRNKKIPKKGLQGILVMKKKKRETMFVIIIKKSP